MCGYEVEDLLHVFFNCPFALACWHVVDAGFDLSMEMSAPLWLLTKIETGPSEEILKIARVLWGVWFFCNKKIWENQIVTAEIAMAWSTKSIEDWKEAVGKPANQGVITSQRSSQVPVKWSKPELGAMKLHVDAVVTLGAPAFFIGLVLRDHTGALVGGYTISKSMVNKVFEAESLAVLEGLTWLASMNHDKVIIEFDSLFTVPALQTSSVNLLEVGFILDACRNILESRSGYKISFVKRQANRVAHLVAKLPCSLNCQNVLTSPSDLLLEALLLDIS